MREVRKYLSWIFAFTALVCVSISFSITPKMLGEYPRVPHLSLWWRIFFITGPWLMPIMAVVFAMASWTSFKQKPSARIWGIIASLINIQIALIPVLVPPHSILNGFLLILAEGVVGLIAFSRRIENSDSALEKQQSAAIPGDGTSSLLNKAAAIWTLVGSGATFAWWLKWMRAKQIPWDHTNTYLALASVLVILLIVAVHECGHAAVGLALGMKLRAFIFGPFQWSIHDGKWQFHFDPRKILAETGATGIVPTVVDFPRWAYVSMLFGGVVINSITGAIALWVASTCDSNGTIQAGGLLALFGAWSLVLAVTNLIPFRTQTFYSDGAQIYQWWANGAWADLHRAFGISGATLVTPLRPRDYDMAVISRASRGITQGPQGLMLRLLAYWHFLDQEKIMEAGEALTQAAQIYNQSASNISAELLSHFVFGAAYLWRKAEVTGIWWKRFENAKPRRFDAEYWLAASALHWVNGNLDDAQKALSKADLLAQKLPSAGAYEFDRYCCSLLRHAFDEVPTPVSQSVSL